MWIRSQDKELIVEVNVVFLGINWGEDEDYPIKTRLNKHPYFLGSYSTKEKALKVLDMLEQCVSGFTDDETDEFYQYGVFRMPLDSEVEDDENN